MFSDVFKFFQQTLHSQLDLCEEEENFVLGGAEETKLMFILKKLRMCFLNIDSHILGLVMSVEGTSKHQKILTKHTLIHL